MRRYRRNPVRFRGVVGQATDLLQSSAAALVGAGVGRSVSNLIPFGVGNPLLTFAKGAGIAVLIRTVGERFVGREIARFAAVGAMLGPTKDLIVSFVPQAEAFLGRTDQVMWMPGFPSQSTLNAYSGDQVAAADIYEDTGSGLSAYSDY